MCTLQQNFLLSLSGDFITPLAVKSGIYLGADCVSKLGFNTTINNLVTPCQVNSSGKGGLACEPMAGTI